MNKRLHKRHKRRVSLAKDRVRLSEPVVRTAVQIRAARGASRPARGLNNGLHTNYSTPSIQNHDGPVAHTPAKADG